ARRARAETAPWHYVDIPISKPHLDMSRDCPRGDCVIVKIEEFEKVLRDPAAEATARREALMFLIHFIGDMHQPLHSSDNGDKGGNGLAVEFLGRQANLHSLWDGFLLSQMPAEDTLYADLSKEAGRRRKWSKGSVEDWAEQAHKASQRV